jgi:hypothetical protein
MQPCPTYRDDVRLTAIELVDLREGDVEELELPGACSA